MTLSIVGLGPGAGADLTPRALAALEASSVIIGYTAYIDLLRDAFPASKLHAMPMRTEVARCKLALERAVAGEQVALVCSGDPGVYGMAGLVYELASEYPPVEVEVVAGISAAQAGAAVLGAPLMHDFATISLSDLLTPWDVIAKRLEAAALADFVVCLYNPASRKRRDHLRRACDILLAHRSAQTVCGYVRNIGREGQECRVFTLEQLRDAEVDMFTTVYIGNSQTRQINGKMVTSRGYQLGER